MINDNLLKESIQKDKDIVRLQDELEYSKSVFEAQIAQLEEDTHVQRELYEKLNAGKMAFKELVAELQFDKVELTQLNEGLQHKLSNIEQQIFNMQTQPTEADVEHLSEGE